MKKQIQQIQKEIDKLTAFHKKYPTGVEYSYRPQRQKDIESRLEELKKAYNETIIIYHLTTGNTEQETIDYFGINKTPYRFKSWLNNSEFNFLV